MCRFRVVAIIALATAPVARGMTYDTLMYPLTTAGGTVQLPGLFAPQSVAGGQAVGSIVPNPLQPGVSDAVLWSSSTGSATNLNPTGMASSGAFGTDGVQQVGGGSNDHALLWSGTAASYVDLGPTDLSSITGAVAYGIAGNEQVGHGSASDGTTHALLWKGTASSAVDLTPTSLPANFNDFYAVGTDGTHQVGGTTDNNGYPQHALLWSGTASSVVDLTPTNLPALVNSWAYGVSGNQQVGVGFATPPPDPFSLFQHALLWTGSGASAVDLTPTNLPGIGLPCEALATNGTQQVGYGENSNAGNQALVWSGTAASAVNLENFLPAAGSWKASVAQTIDSSGNVFGTAVGTLNSVNTSYAAEWLPSTDTGPVVVAPGALYHFSAGTGTGMLDRSLAGLTINASGSAIVDPATTHASRQLLVLGGLTLGGSTGSWTGKLDLGNSDLDVAGASLGTVENQIRQGYNNGKWNGSGGITSAAAASDSTHLSAIGVIQNNQGGLPLFTASHQFDGVTPGASDLLMKFTYLGDANLDGKVDGSDYSRIDNGFLAQASGWYNGDFNYDGVVNGSDYTLIDNAFNTQGASLSDSVAAVETDQLAMVPEPASVGLLAMASIAVFGRRNRRFRAS